MFDHINQKRYLPFLTTKALKVRNMLARVRLKKKNTSFQPIENFPSIMQTKEIGQYLSCGGGGGGENRRSLPFILCWPQLIPTPFPKR